MQCLLKVTKLLSYLTHRFAKSKFVFILSYFLHPTYVHQQHEGLFDISSYTFTFNAQFSIQLENQTKRVRSEIS